MMALHFRHIASLSDPLDKEVSLLHKMKRSIPAGSQVSFSTNLSDDEASQRAYYQTQFGWCPMLLSNDVSINDNLLVYHSDAAKDSDLIFLHQCDTIRRDQGEGYTLLLLRKTKNK
jgi:hypothetical protein